MKQDSPRRAHAVPRLRDRIRETTANEILAAAEQVFAEAGLEAARVETIAARAGIAVGTVYNYFTDRDALLVALFAARRSELLADLDAAIASAQDLPWRLQLEAFLRAILTHAEAHRRFFTILFQGDTNLGPCTSMSGRAHRATMHELRVRAEALLHRGIAAGVVTAVDAEVYPAVLLGMVRGVIMHVVVHESPRAMTDFVPAVTQLFLTGASGSVS